MNDGYLDPPEELTRRRIPGMNNVYEIWETCPMCKGERIVKKWFDGEIVKDECPICDGEGGKWEMETRE